MLLLTKESVPNSRPIVGWVNGNMYVPTSEVFGILPIPPDIRFESGIPEYLQPSQPPQRFEFLASKQGTQKAVLPVHTPQEYKLFSQLMRDHPVFNQPENGPSWVQAVKVWNRNAENRAEVFYKVTDYIYYERGGTDLMSSRSSSISRPTTIHGRLI
jgi:hypothetical protein